MSTWSLASSEWEHVKRKMHPCTLLTRFTRAVDMVYTVVSGWMGATFRLFLLQSICGAKNLKYIWSNKGAVKEVISNILIIRPKSDHCLALSVSNSLLLLRLLSSSKKVVCAPRSTRPNLSFVNLEWQILAVIWKEKKIIQFSDVGGWLLAIYNPWGFCHQRHRIEMISFPASFISWNLLHYDFQENLPPTLFWQGDAVKPKTHSDYCYGCFWRTGQLHKLFFEGNN